MLLCADIGNTNITLGIYNNDDLLFTARLATDKSRTADQYAVEIKDVLEINGVDYSKVDSAAISSVVPSVGGAVEDALLKLCKVKPLVIGPGVKTGLNIKIDNPAQLGADLVAGAVGALSKCKTPCIVIDMGTATTVTVLDKDGALLGGAIAAGVRLTLDALANRTSQLPYIDIKAPKSVIGTNTVDCMRSGLIFGAVSMIDGLIERIENELGQPAYKIATGGLSREVIKHSKFEIDYNDNLLLDGLKIIYNKN